MTYPGEFLFRFGPVPLAIFLTIVFYEGVPLINRIPFIERVPAIGWAIQGEIRRRVEPAVAANEREWKRQVQEAETKLNQKERAQQAKISAIQSDLAEQRRIAARNTMERSIALERAINAELERDEALTLQQSEQNNGCNQTCQPLRQRISPRLLRQFQ